MPKRGSKFYQLGVEGMDTEMNPNFFDYELIKAIQPSIDDNYFTPVIDSALALLPKASEPYDVMDIGCGNGLFTVGLKRKVSCNLYGVDASNEGLNDALKNGFDEVQKISDFCADKLPFSGKKFDLVICKDVLEHLLFPDKLVSQFSSIIKKDGKLIVAVPNHFSAYGRLRFLFTNNIDTWGYFPDNRRWNFPHVRFFTTDALTNLMWDNGFQIIKNCCSSFPSMPVGRVFPKIVKSFLAQNSPDNFAEGLVFIYCRKNDLSTN